MIALTIGQLAEQAGIGVETIRFYEREGLIPDPPRRASGYRTYGPDSVNRLRFITNAKELGFSLKEINDLLSLRVGNGVSCADLRERAQQKLSDIHAKIQSLNRMKRGLERLATACRGRGPTSDCPILEALDGEEVQRA